MTNTKVDYGVTSKESSEPPTRDRQEYLKPDAGQKRTTTNSQPTSIKIPQLPNKQILDKLIEPHSIEHDNLSLLLENPLTRVGALLTLEQITLGMNTGDVKPLLQHLSTQTYNEPQLGIYLDGTMTNSIRIEVLLKNPATKRGALLTIAILNKVADKKREYPESLY